MTEAQSVALERRPIQVPVALVSDDEIRRLFRVAEALARSNMFKDAQQAEQAFAKMIVGRDLGMSPAQAMLGLHLVEGSVQVHYSMLGRFVKAREDEGYAYRAGWIKEEIQGEEASVELPERTFVWMDEDDPADRRRVVGASVTFTVHGRTVGVSTFTLEDAETAKIIKDRGAWKTHPRNMLLARAMSNGVKWYVPEVMGGLPIYTEGEIVEGQDSVTAPVGGGSDEGQGLELGPKVEAIIERAQKAGHAGLSNRGALELALGDRAPSVVNKWIVDANAELDRFEQQKREALEAEEPPEAEVVEDVPLGQEPTLAEQAAEDKTMQDMQTQVLQRRLENLTAARGEEQDPEQRALIDEEIEHVKHQLGLDESEES